jgi:hypothetical protein
MSTHAPDIKKQNLQNWTGLVNLLYFFKRTLEDFDY